MFVVAGVTGNTGSVVADRLLASGASVRVVVRDEAKGAPWAAKGAQVAVADLLDAGALKRAFAGAKGAYVLLPPNPASTGFVAEQAAKADAVARAVEAAALSHLVLLSSVAAQFPAGTGPIVTVGQAERRFASVAPRLTYVRAAYFMENFASALGGLSDGVFPTFLDPEVPFDMVATRDIGRVAADALLHGGVDGTEVVELASGPGPYSPRDVARALGALVGRELQVVRPPLDTMVPTLRGFGFSEDVARLYHEMTVAFGAGGDPWERKGWFVRGTTTPSQVFAGLLGR